MALLDPGRAAEAETVRARPMWVDGMRRGCLADSRLPPGIDPALLLTDAPELGPDPGPAPRADDPRDLVVVDGGDRAPFFELRSSMDEDEDGEDE